MIKYLYHFKYAYATKNKLEKAVAEYLASMDRFVVNNDNFLNLQETIQLAIKSLNEQHPRCKPVELHFWAHNHKDIDVNVGFVKAEFMKFEEPCICC